MPVPVVISDLSTTAGSNYPQGTDVPGAGDDVIRAHASFIALLRNKLDGTSATVTLTSPALTTPAFTGNPTGTVVSGTYTPTLTNVTNITSTTAYLCQYSRVGPTITVSGMIDVSVTSSSAASVIRISLPIASAFAAFYDCAGTCCDGSDFSQSGSISAHVSTDTAQMSFRAITATPNINWAFHFTYRVI